MSFPLLREPIQQIVVIAGDMRRAALNAMVAGAGRKRIFNQQFSGFVCNAKRIAIITDHIDQIGQFNTIDIHGNPAHVEGQDVDSISFHCEGEFHRVPPLYLPVVMSVTTL